MEQLFMKLNDPVLRPKFNSSKIPNDHPKFKKLVDDYVKWSDDTTYDMCSREDYENDIRGCFGQFSLDGYELAEYLKNEIYVSPDASLVHLLEDVSYVKESITKEIVRNWVNENFLKISDDVLGKKVNATQGIRKYENHYITGIYHDTYQVTISENSNNKGGWVIDFENIQFQ